MDSLPNELFIQIASHLDSEPPSITKFAHEPSTKLTCCDFTPLKLLSQVSWRWRRIVIPILFRYSRISLDTEPQWVPIDARLVDSMQGQLTTLSNHEFQIYHRMRSKFKSSSTFAYDEAFDDLLINLCRVQDGDEFLKSVPHILWLPHLPRTFPDFGQFVAQYSLKHHIKSIVVNTDKDYELRHVSTADAPLARAVSEIWSQIFSCLEPTRVVVAAPPTTLAGLLDTQMLSSDVWAFDMKIHYIELLQAEPLRLEHMSSNCRPWDWALVHRRPWYHLGYNEGSSITAYSTYEYHLKQSPKMLYLILIRLAKEAQACCNITSFTFIGVFPFATNVTTIIRALHRIPTLKRVSVQFAPGPENTLLSEPGRLGRAQSSDFWLEWTESYKVIASYLGVFDFADGAEFTSGDCDNERQAIEVGECMDLLKRRGAGWRKEGKVTWVRDHELDEEGAVAEVMVV
ncbi:Nn.00g105130.m01.CDS01 [Neocucurbitaria sp. VM-36]